MTQNEIDQSLILLRLGQAVTTKTRLGVDGTGELITVKYHTIANNVVYYNITYSDNSTNECRRSLQDVLCWWADKTETLTFD